MLTASCYLDFDPDRELIRKSVYRRIGYNTDAELRPRIASLVEEYLDHAKHLIQSSFSCVVRRIEQVQGPIVIIENSIHLTSRIIARLLKLCQKVAMFALTIGHGLEERVRELADQGLVLESYLLDAIGSSLTEKMADSVQETIDQRARSQGLSISRRFSPGYCDWHISQQGAIFQAIQSPHLDIKLSKDYFMLPQKSISGIIGLGSPGSNIVSYSPCKTCKKHDCPGRR
ncbi:MAG: vitamin B12 dependent-methionine synthase activation domain-containing protein [Dehalococcoidia bacterium]|nr:vitamin B12 dependent-methionine synthase activation domain-containing protein [Dehalococcoidia bacterium]